MFESSAGLEHKATKGIAKRLLEVSKYYFSKRSLRRYYYVPGIPHVYDRLIGR